MGYVTSDREQEKRKLRAVGPVRGSRRGHLGPGEQELEERAPRAR